MAYTDDDLEEALRQRYRNQSMDLSPDARNRLLNLDLTQTQVPTYPADLLYGALSAPSQAVDTDAIMKRIGEMPDVATAEERAGSGWGQVGMAALSDKSPPAGDDSIQESWDIMDIFPPEGMASLGAAGVKGLAAKGMAMKGASAIGPMLAAGEIKGVIQGGKSKLPLLEEFSQGLNRLRGGKLDTAEMEDLSALQQRLYDAGLTDEGDRMVSEILASHDKGRAVAPSTEQPADLDRAWREMQGIPDEAPISAADKLAERGANVKRLPVPQDEYIEEPKTHYDTIKQAITRNLPARFGPNPPKGGFVYKTPVSTRKDGATVIDTYGRGDVHNAPYTLDGTPKSTVAKREGWNEPQPFPADPDDIRGKLPAKGKPIVIGAKSDPFMWMDQKYRGSAALLEDLFGYPNVTLNTRSDLIAHDDYLELLQGLDNPTINIHVPKVGLGTENRYEASVTRQLQPGAPSIKRRVLAYKKLKDAGYNVNLVPEVKLGKMPGTSKALQPVSDIEFKAMIKHYMKQAQEE